MRHGRTYSKGHHMYSSEIPTLVGSKGVYYHPRMREFLKCVSDFAARIVIWSSMKRTTVSSIANYLFHGLPLPFAILGQDHCQTIDVGEGKCVLRGNDRKLIFLKIMPNQLFNSLAKSWPFTNDNTLLIDDSSEKNVCNESGNAIFMESWSRQRLDFNFLMDTLAPWLISLSSNCKPGQFRKYVDENRIGVPPMSADDPLLLHLMRGMAMSVKNVGVHYNVIGIPGLNCD